MLDYWIDFYDVYYQNGDGGYDGGYDDFDDCDCEVLVCLRLL